jgi:hypothetical protein
MFVDLTQIFKIRKVWQASELSTDNFLKKYKLIFENIEIGGTFIPENLTHEGLDCVAIMKCLSFLVEDLGIRSLRLGLRLNKINIDKNNIGIYENVLRYCFLHKVNLTLNLGPIKYCGWPEYHLSDQIKSSVMELPAIKSIVNSDCELSIKSLIELEKFLKFIVAKFTKLELSNVIALQAENEGFNPFGEYKWTFDEKHISSIIKLFDIYLPHKKILFNSAGFFDLAKIVDFIKKRKDARRFIVGLDYYYTFDKVDKFKFYHWLDLFVCSWKVKDFSLFKLKKIQLKYGFETEITEAQMESWGSALEPGNSVKSLKFVLLRSSQFLRDYSGNINMYGIDRLAKNAIQGGLSHEHIQMIQLIKKIQNKHTFGYQ